MKFTSISFQSTHPKRDETPFVAMVPIAARFQSTHPKRDETGDLAIIFLANRISIHSSQAG